METRLAEMDTADLCSAYGNAREVHDYLVMDAVQHEMEMRTYDRSRACNSFLFDRRGQ